jgi:hypothetical protein
MALDLYSRGPPQGRAEAREAEGKAQEADAHAVGRLHWQLCHTQWATRGCDGGPGEGHAKTEDQPHAKRLLA